MIRFSGLQIAQAFVLGMVAMGLVPLLGVALYNGATLRLDSAIFPVLWFTLKQAGLSTLLAVLPAVFLALAFERSNFPGRQVLLAGFAIPLATPVIVAILGLTALFGAGGIFPDIINLYSLQGILLAHVFFNLPLATRIFLLALQNVSPESIKLAEQLGFDRSAIFRHIEWPSIKQTLPQVCALVFLLCAASFVIVLNFGGATSTTLEVAIYQSLQADFDVQRALQLSAVQVILCGICVGFAARVFHSTAVSTPLRKCASPTKFVSKSEQLLNVAYISVVSLFVFSVLAVVSVQGFSNIRITSSHVFALTTSIGLASCSSVLAVALAWPLAQARMPSTQLFALAAYLIPPAVLATGWFVAFHQFGEHLVLTLSLIAVLNALMALPFSVSALSAGFSAQGTQLARLSEQLGISGWNLFVIVQLPLLRRPLAQAALLAFVVAIGDLTAITLLGTQGIKTLPSLLRSEMGHYRATDAMGTALLLMLLSMILTILADKLGERNA